MLKLACLLIVATMAISWSQVEAKPYHSKNMARSAPYKRFAPLAHAARPKRSAEDNEIDEIEDLSVESQEKLMKALLAGLLLMTVESGEEQDRLGAKFGELVEQKFDSLDDFGTALASAYEEVTGRDPDEVDESED